MSWLAINCDGIAEDLKKLDQWILWKAVKRDGRLTKVPFQVNGTEAKSNDPSTWAPYQETVATFELERQRLGYHGIAFVFSGDDPFFGVDMDSCLDKDGNLQEWAARILQRIGSYTEISPSGSGIKIVARGSKPTWAKAVCKNKTWMTAATADKIPEIAIYDTGRYWCLTGAHLDGTPTGVRDCQEGLDYLCKQLWPQAPAPVESNGAVGRAAGNVADCLRDMLRIAVGQENDGSRRLYTVACRAVEHNLSDADAVACVNAYHCLRPFPKAWTREDVLRRLRDAERETERGKVAPEGVTYRRLTTAELDAGDFSVEYLVEGILVAQQPMIVAGPQKALKTSFMIDLAISLSTAGKFLGYFDVNRAAKVAVMTGESGLGVIQETARRVCKVAGRTMSDVGVIWSPDLPRFDSLPHMAGLADFLRGDEIEVAIIDPAYLAMPGDDAGNLFKQGALLRNMVDVCQQNGVMMILAHHTRSRPLQLRYQAPRLEDIAWAGFQEFARQWLLVGRRAEYDVGSGSHELWLSAGGSAGHSGLYGVDVNEGTQADEDGRRWDVDVVSPQEVQERAAKAAEIAKVQDAEQRQKEHERRVQDILRLSDGETLKTIRDLGAMNSASAGRAINALRKAGLVEPCEVVRGNNRKYDGYRLTETGK